jgi:glycosyltransferase involved in cell wall biosynthesis
MNDKAIRTSILLPCLNEEESIESCVQNILDTLRSTEESFELVIVNNDSTDNTPAIAKALSDKNSEIVVVHELRRGYGSAYLCGFEHARGDFMVMLDCDNTYDVSTIPQFIKALEAGNDFVIGDRFKGGIEKDAMPALHRYIGNPVLSNMVRLFFGTTVRDVHCGLRAISKEAFQKMNVQTSGMEFASEMVVKAVKRKLRVAEIPVPYSKRTGESKLRSFADGWRHLRYILLYSPMIVFLLPGITLLVLGGISMILIYFDLLVVFGKQFVIHPAFISSLAIICGFQLISFAGFAKAYAVTHLKEENHFLQEFMEKVTIEKALIAGSLIILIGIMLFIYVLKVWIDADFGGLDNQIKTSVVALTALVLGIQIISSAFMTSILGIQEK